MPGETPRGRRLNSIPYLVSELARQHYVDSGLFLKIMHFAVQGGFLAILLHAMTESNEPINELSQFVGTTKNEVIHELCRSASFAKCL
jgi:hypothetical protein